MSIIAANQGVGRALLLAGVLAFPLLAFPGVSPSERQRAIAAFEDAQRLRTTLESQPESRRRKGDYRKVITAFEEVYRLNPAYSKTPAALAAVAELYEEMGRLFESDSYYLQSVKTYRHLVKEYPGNRLSRDALFTLAEIYRTDLADPEEARQGFREFIKTYPHAEKAAEAQEKLKLLEPQPRETAEEKPPPEPHDRPATGLRGGTPELTAVRRWIGPNYSRIVIGVEGEVKFSSVRLSNPDRVVLDLQNARLSPALVGKTFPVEDGFLRQIRVAQFSPTVARVVLDVEKIEAYSIFSLPNPFRLVIDVQGTPPTETAKLAKPIVPALPETLPPSESRTSKKNQGSKRASPPHSTEPTVAAGQPPSVSSDTNAESGDTSAANADETSPEAPKHSPVPSRRKDGSEETASSESNSEDQGTSAANTDEAPAKTQKHPSMRSNRKEENEETPSQTAHATLPPSAPSDLGSRTLTRALGLKIGRIVIDPGHGGHDTGTVGPTGLEEKNVVLDVALRLRKLLERDTGCDVIMTRSDDTFIPLEERTAIANEKGADLFLSIHANASRDKSARGIETYYLNFTSSSDALEVAARENSTSQESVHELQDLIKKIAMTEKIEESQDFAKKVQREVYARVMKTAGAQRDRGVKKAPFVVLIGANMPSVLAEISFLSNPQDERLLRRADHREKIAGALLDGIEEYLKNLGGVRAVQRAASKETSSFVRPDF